MNHNFDAGISATELERLKVMAERDHQSSELSYDRQMTVRLVHTLLRYKNLPGIANDLAPITSQELTEYRHRILSLLLRNPSHAIVKDNSDVIVELQRLGWKPLTESDVR